jgi:hypothetical protein
MDMSTAQIARLLKALSPAEQLTEELEAAFVPWWPILNYEPHSIRLSAEHIADHLSGIDERVALEACLTVMSILWPLTHASPEDVGRADWWATPLGRLCARSLACHDTAAVTHAVAASMLGVERGYIGTLVHRGRLDRHEDGGVTRSSVLRRIAVLA